MSEEHLQESTDETLVLKNQFGCMSAIFQMFESHRVLPGKRVRTIIKGFPKIASLIGMLESKKLSKDSRTRETAGVVLADGYMADLATMDTEFSLDIKQYLPQQSSIVESE